MKKYTLLWLSLFVLLCSCDPVGYASFYVNNNSGGKVYLYVNDTLFTDSVAAGEKKIILCDCGVGGGSIPSGIFYNGKSGVPYAKVANDTATCKKDIMLEASWELVLLAEKQHEYVFTVRDSDF